MADSKEKITITTEEASPQDIAQTIADAAAAANEDANAEDRVEAPGKETTVSQQRFRKESSFGHYRDLEFAFIFIAVIALICVIFGFVQPQINIPLVAGGGITLALCIAAGVYTYLNPSTTRANQTNTMLRIASDIVDYMKNGLTADACLKICRLLLPRTRAIAVAITDKVSILGYVGYLEEENKPGSAIRTAATKEVMQDGKMHILYSAESIGLPPYARRINGAIIVPIAYAGMIVGTLKFYYRRSYVIDDTEISIAQGMGKLISTEYAATRYEEQRTIATTMELKMLQAQVNPHFLFNTINTITSLIRTDPARARELLRDFATFYRATLENSQDQIDLSEELEQTIRYFSLEEARFGKEKIGLKIDIEKRSRSKGVDIMNVKIPPFILQPLVENSVRHAMPAQGKLNVVVRAYAAGDDLMLSVEDDGIGMSEATLANVMVRTSSQGLGMALKNVRDRLKGFYGKDARMHIESKPNEGTEVTLCLPNVLAAPVLKDVS